MTLGEKKIRLRNLLTDFLWMLEDAEDIKALDITKPTLQSEYNETIVSGKQAVFELLKDTVLHEVWSDVYGVPKRNADRPAWGNYAATGGNINRRKREFRMRRQAVDCS